MKITKKELPKNQLELTIELEPKEYQKFLEETAQNMSKNSKIPGFRPGKAPYNIISRKFGEMHIFEQAKSQVSGLAKRARFVMSHTSGKIEIVGVSENQVYMKYHRAADGEDSGEFMIFQRNPNAYWFDDYQPNVPLHSKCWLYDSYGPE